MRILAVGVATIDIVNTVGRYPPEDGEVRALEHHVSLGGNASNTLVVLSRLGHHCSLAGAIADDPGSRQILQQLQQHGVETHYLARHANSITPTSYITLSRQSGSRTIVHYRRLAEFGWRDFSRIATGQFDWIHFEGRNIPDLRRMMAALKARPEIACSLEVEKAREGIEELFPLTGLLLFSRGYARHQGFSEAASFLAGMRDQVTPGTTLACAWGEQGAWGMDGQGGLFHAPAFPPPRVVDTVGAGDVFNAGVIHGQAAGEALSGVLTRACRLAGEKCGRKGLT